jgi:hypothetical protein
MAAAEIVAGVYFDALSRWLAGDAPPSDLRQALNARLDLLLTGRAADAGPATRSRGA